MAKKWENVKWIVDDNKAVIRVVLLFRNSGRCICKDKNGKEYVVSKYDIYDTLTAANEAANEELPS